MKTQAICKRDRNDVPCLANIFVLSGVVTVCESCASSISGMRDVLGYTLGSDGFYESDRLMEEQRAAIDELKLAIDDGGKAGNRG